MSMYAMQWADRLVELHPELSPVDRAVLTRLAYRAHAGDGHAFPGLDRLMTETGFGRSAVKASIRRLRELIPIERRRGGGIHWIFPADPTLGMSFPDPAELSPGGHETTPRHPAKLSPGGRGVTQGGRVVTPRGSRGDPKPKGTETKPALVPYVTRPHRVEHERALVDDVEQRDAVPIASLPVDGWRAYRDAAPEPDLAVNQPGRTLVATIAGGGADDDVMASPLDFRFAEWAT